MSNAFDTGKLNNNGLYNILEGKLNNNRLYNIPEKESTRINFEPRDKQKIQALLRTLLTLEVEPPQCEAQATARHYEPGTINILGYVDSKSNDQLFKFKLSSRPDWYDKLFNIHDQVGTYFMSDEGLNLLNDTKQKKTEDDKLPGHAR